MSVENDMVDIYFIFFHPPLPSSLSFDFPNNGTIPLHSILIQHFFGSQIIIIIIIVAHVSIANGSKHVHWIHTAQMKCDASRAFVHLTRD